MSDINADLIRHIYNRFNARDIDGVLAALAEDVEWANAMEGGYVHGHEAIRDYWTRQWTIVSPHVEPKEIRPTSEGVYAAEVVQRIFDLQGRPLGDQTQGLKDKTVFHIFTIRGNKITRFDVSEFAGS